MQAKPLLICKVGWMEHHGLMLLCCCFRVWTLSNQWIQMCIKIFMTSSFREAWWCNKTMTQSTQGNQIKYGWKRKKECFSESNEMHNLQPWSTDKLKVYLKGSTGYYIQGSTFLFQMIDQHTVCNKDVKSIFVVLV